MDTILIEDLEVNAIIGTLPEERLEAQRLILNLEIFTDFTAAGASDDLNDAVDYSMLEGAVKILTERSQFQLLEALGSEICRTVLSVPQVDRVKVRISKPGAARFARTISICMERSR